MKTNKILMQESRKDLSNNWETPIAAYFIHALIMGMGNSVSLIIGGPMQFGACFFALNVASKKDIEIGQIFEGFNKRFGESLVAYLLMSIFIFLWSMLFFIPGIIASFAYSQTFFILASDSEISGSDALKKSKQIMKGNKFKYFCLNLRFTGWLILAMMTFGIGLLWLSPYMTVSRAKFYNDITQ